ncbi:MAG: tetratricopeptide repeat protein [bacterium]
MRQHKNLFYILLLTIVTLLIYAHTSNYGFLNWDDNKDILNKPRIEHLSMRSVVHLFNPSGIFQGQYFYEYFPITDLSYMIEWHFYGETFAQGFHLDNILLHLINVLLLFFAFRLLLKRYTSGNENTPDLKNIDSSILSIEAIAFIGAMMFAVSPVMVETVSWLACRKDLLLLMFYLIWFIAYMKERYVIAFLMFVCAILSKFQGVTIPGVLVGYELFIHRQDIVKILKRLIPYIVILTVYVPYTMWYYNKGGTAFVDKLGTLWTLMFIPEMIFLYLRKLFLPFGLVPVYTIPAVSNIILFIVSVVCFFILVVWIITLFKKKQYLQLFGLSWFFANLVPVSNIVPLPTKIADRYVYEAGLGVFLIVSLWIWSAYQQSRYKKLFTGVVVLIFCVSAFLSYKQTLHWQNNITLWSHTLKYQPDSYIAWNNIGTEYEKQGHEEKAIYAFEQSLKYNPDFVPALWNMGKYYLQNNDYIRALPLFSRMCEIHSKEQYLGCRAAGAIYLKYYNQPLIAKRYFEQSYMLNPQQPDAQGLKYIIDTIQ